VRLSIFHWAMLRSLMQRLGRGWLEKAIEREYQRQEKRALEEEQEKAK